jgi:hypothetical protein
MEQLTGYMATGVVSVIVGLLLRSLEAKAKVVFWQPHYALFRLQNPQVSIQSDSINVQNIGRKKADNLEIVFRARPDNFMFAPPVPFVEATAPTGEFIIKIASLGPKEFLTLHLLSHLTPPKVEQIRSDAGRAAAIPFRMQRKFPQWFNFLAGFLMLVGFGFCAYWVIRAVVFISGNIGIV